MDPGVGVEALGGKLRFLGYSQVNFVGLIFSYSAISTILLRFAKLTVISFVFGGAGGTVCSSPDRLLGISSVLRIHTTT